MPGQSAPAVEQIGANSRVGQAGCPARADKRLNYQAILVARDRIELPTRGFSAAPNPSTLQRLAKVFK